MCRAAGPSILSVDDSGRPQDFAKLIKGAVHVADGDDALDAIELTRRLRRPGTRGGREHRCDEHPRQMGLAHAHRLAVLW